MKIRVISILALYFSCFAVIAKEPPIFFDQGLKEIKLNDFISGKAILKDSDTSCKDIIVDYYCFVNQKRTQSILLEWHPGSNEFTISEITVRYGEGDSNYHVYPLELADFVTTKGIKLGVSPSFLIEQLGEPSSIESNIYKYHAVSDPYIQETYNMPIYYGKYKFEENKLVEFKFGFEYP